ncbi:MAG: hypothetical protein HQM10_07890 [Candidatus Riflebacteria bacterium]|nr:hypothetical protein [Candidatus Riflebacteria bacterium]
MMNRYNYVIVVSVLFLFSLAPAFPANLTSLPGIEDFFIDKDSALFEPAESGRVHVSARIYVKKNSNLLLAVNLKFSFLMNLFPKICCGKSLDSNCVFPFWKEYGDLYKSVLLFADAEDLFPECFKNIVTRKDEIAS